MKNSMQILSAILITTFLIFLNSCEEEESGCTDTTACNYDSSATEDDNSCIYPNECDSCEDDNSCLGCTDPIAVSYTHLTLPTIVEV